MAKRVTSNRTMKNQGGGGGPVSAPMPKAADGGAKNARDLRNRIDQGITVTFVPEAPPEVDHKYRDRVTKLNQLFTAQRSRRRLGKRVDLDVIHDNRIPPGERLDLFVQAAVNEGYREDDAIEVGLEILEGLGDDIAGAGNNPGR